VIITIDVHETRHTCPATTDPHWIDRQTTIVTSQDDGPCRNPVTVRAGAHHTTIACGRTRPRDQQCVACRSLLIVRNVTYTDLGHQAPQPQPFEVSP